jgi:putative salt-induced outer membrane protein
LPPVSPAVTIFAEAKNYSIFTRFWRQIFMFRKCIFSVAVVLLANSGFAQGTAAAPAEEEGPWSGSVSLGYLSTSGNTDTTTYNTKFDITYTKNKWSHTLNGAANGNEDTDEHISEAYQVGWKTDYNFTEHDYLFGLVNWRKDRFSGVVEQLSESIGYGRRLINTPAHLLSAEIGAGYKDADLSDGSNETGAIIRGGLDYTWTFTEKSGFDQHIGVEAGSDNTYIESVSALRANLIGAFAMVLSYTVRHNTDVPASSEKTDKLTAISIEYAF